MPNQPEKVICSQCRRPALRIEVRKYFWRNPDGRVVPVENALIIKCVLCGEYAADGDEKKRWEKEKTKKDAIEADPDEQCCDSCGKPSRLTGQFFTYGRVPERKGYCRDCHDTLGLGT